MSLDQMTLLTLSRISYKINARHSGDLEFVYIQIRLFRVFTAKYVAVREDCYVPLHGQEALALLAAVTGVCVVDYGGPSSPHVEASAIHLICEAASICSFLGNCQSKIIIHQIIS